MPLAPDLLRSSFALVVERNPDLTSRFYQILFERYPQVRPLFRGRTEDQARMLTEALAAVIDHVDDVPWLASTLGTLGRRHVAYGVTAEMYPWVADAMLAALAETAGAAWTDQVSAAWADALGAIAQLMLAGAAEAEAEAAAA